MLTERMYLYSLSQDDLQAWLAVDLEHPNSCNFNRLLNHMFSLCVSDGLTIDNDILLDRRLKDVLPIRHLEEVINCIKAYCAEAPNTGRDRYALNDPSLDNVAARAVDGVHHGMLNDWSLAPIIGLSWHDGIQRMGTRLFMAVDLCHPNFWAGLNARLYRHELEGKFWVLPWTHLQCDEKNVIRSHPKLVPWMGDLDAARNAKNGMYSDWKDYAPLAGWESEWPLAKSLCGMLFHAHYARVLVNDNYERNPNRYPKPEDAELAKEAVYEQFWAKVKQFYEDGGDMKGYEALSVELCLGVDL
ncbi:hypothetical protein OF83DRAFT_767088 [Amylostereum chailletii]|nr:hypothetical protein OF83DRAFT_767088 [Amylostereum chailletii]